jgi:hypothetical protein
MQTVEERFDNIFALMKQIPMEGITLLTGSNGSGKSLIRSQMCLEIQDRLNLSKPALVTHASMSLRTSSNASMGALGGMARDVDWLATSYNTLHLLSSVFKSSENAKLVCIDEPEIGLGEETQLAVASYLNEELPKLNKPCLVITHSRLIVQNLKFDFFLNMDGYKTAEDWLNRPIMATDLNKLKENELFFYIRELLHNKKNK